MFALHDGHMERYNITVFKQLDKMKYIQRNGTHGLHGTEGTGTVGGPHSKPVPQRSTREIFGGEMSKKKRKRRVYNIQERGTTRIGSTCTTEKHKMTNYICKKETEMLHW